MENKPNFKYKIHCEWIIVSNNISPTDITEKLQIKPIRAYSKGEVFKSKKSGTEGKRNHNLWAIISDAALTEDEDISSHIQHFKNLLAKKSETISWIKTDPDNEISFWIWIEADKAGVGIDIPETDLEFINTTSNRLHVSVLPYSS